MDITTALQTIAVLTGLVTTLQAQVTTLQASLDAATEAALAMEDAYLQVLEDLPDDAAVGAVLRDGLAYDAHMASLLG